MAKNTQVSPEKTSKHINSQNKDPKPTIKPNPTMKNISYISNITQDQSIINLDKSIMSNSHAKLV